MKPDRYWHAYCGPCRRYLMMSVRHGRHVTELMCRNCGRFSAAYKSTAYPLKGADLAVAYKEKEGCRRSNRE